jgi:hypothetical protein
MKKGGISNRAELAGKLGEPFSSFFKAGFKGLV